MRRVVGGIGGMIGALVTLAAHAEVIGQPGSSAVQPSLQRQSRSDTRRNAPGSGITVADAYTATLALAPTGSFTLSNSSGNVVISGSGNVVRIDAVKRASGADEHDARVRIDAIGIEITVDNGAVLVRTTIPEGAGESGAVDFTITLPPSVAVTARAFLGDVQVSNVSGPVAASTVSGHLFMSALGDVRVASTISGDIEIRDSRGTQVSMATLNGTASVRGLTASSLDLEVGNGSVSCVDVRADRAYLRTDSGDLEYSGPLARGGLYQVQSQSGSIRFTPTNDTGFSLDASSFRGNTRSQFPFPAEAMTADTRGRSQTIRGAVGDTSASVTLRSLSGDVTLNRP